MLLLFLNPIGKYILQNNSTLIYYFILRHQFSKPVKKARMEMCFE